MLKKQLAQGNNGLTKTKYLTFGIEAESMRQAKPRLNHIENDLLNNFRRLGVIATTMNGKERLHLMHSMFHMGDNDKFFFDWKYLVESGLSVKDFIAPTAFAFKTNRTFQMGSIFGSMSYLAITASDLSDRMLADFLDMESTQIVTMHIQSVDQTAAIKTIKRIITELDRSKIEEQKKAVRSGYDMDIIPSDLATYGKDAKSLLKELQSQNERMFMVTFLVLNTGRTEQELENNVFQAQSIAQKHNCNLRRLDFQQESGLMSSLPLAQNLIEIRRGLTTSSTAIFVPFTTQELFQNGGETLYYGLNALSNNLIMVDRKKLKKAPAPKQFQMLIDIQAKMAEGKTVGYEKWAKKFNRKEAARTVILLKEKGLGNYDDLTAHIENLSARFDALSDSIKVAEKRMVEVQALQQHIKNYRNTRQIYIEYRKSGYSKKFFEEHRQEITIHKAAKQAFDELQITKLPSMQSLYEEFHQLAVQKKQDYAEYRQIRKEKEELLIAKRTVETILNIDRQKEQEKEKEKEEKKNFR